MVSPPNMKTLIEIKGLIYPQPSARWNYYYHYYQMVNQQVFEEVWREGIQQGLNIINSTGVNQIKPNGGIWDFWQINGNHCNFSNVYVPLMCYIVVSILLMFMLITNKLD